MQKLFHYGPIGAHLEWLWQRQEFKFYWDPMNWPFMPHLNVDWYVNTRLGFESVSHLPQDVPGQGSRRDLSFENVVPHVKVIAYDCCAAVGAVGDDFMRAFGVLRNVPDYNARSRHRVFGRGAKDLGGIDPGRLAEVMNVFLLGGLLSTYRKAREMPGFNTIKHVPRYSRYDAADFVENILPWLKKAQEYKDKAKKLKDKGDIGQAKTEESNARKMEEQLSKIVGKGRKLPTRDDIPYEQLFQEAMKRVSRR
jgi:hypothetical protein